MTLSKERTEGFRIRQNIPSREITTFGAGVGVSQLIEPESITSLLKILPELEEPLILGNGSNLILPDYEIERPVIRLPKSLTGPVTEDSEIFFLLDKFPGEKLFAGTSVINLSRIFSQAGKSGLEFAAGIPGTLGGAIKMNAGAHGDSFQEIVSGVVVADPLGRLLSLSLEELDYSYRHSAITKSQIVLAASLLLKDGDANEIRKKRESCLQYRTKTQPLKMPSAGSVFRNPEGVDNQAAAYYLEKVGLKGTTSGGVGYSTMHSNWLVRHEESAKASDVTKLIDLGKKRVFEEYGLNLTPEILLW